MNHPKQPPIYAYPRLSKTDLLFIRIGGNGLGNLMFTWARCLAASERHGWQPIWPTWQWRKPWRLARYRWIPEQQAVEHGAPPGSVVEFRGMEGMFEPFRAQHELVYGELLRMARPEHLRALENSDPAPIGIHVRRGDFVQQGSYEQMISQHNSLLPMEWYVAALRAVRSAAGGQPRAYVFSDGTDEELAPLLDLPAVERADYGSGLGDMLGLSRSRLIIASGSTFSMWGSFLGQVPAIWHPGKLLQHLLLEHPEREIEWAEGDALPAWVGEVMEDGRTP